MTEEKKPPVEWLKTWANNHPIAGWLIAITFSATCLKITWETFDFFVEKIHTTTKETDIEALVNNPEINSVNNSPTEFFIPTPNKNLETKPKPTPKQEIIELKTQDAKLAKNPINTKQLTQIDEKPPTSSRNLLPEPNKNPIASNSHQPHKIETAEIKTDTPVEIKPLPGLKSIYSSIDHPPPIQNQKNIDKENSSAIRSSTKSVLSALKGQVGSSRFSSIRAALNALPSDLNANEIAALLDTEVGTSRLKCFEILLSKTKKNSLYAVDIPLILGNELGTTKSNMIGSMATFIIAPISGNEAGSILKHTVGSGRVDSIKYLAPLLKKPITDEAAAIVLGDLVGSSRTEAIALLFSQ